MKEFETSVVDSDKDERWIILKETAFYPVGGGQPSDTGSVSWDSGSARIMEVRKKNGIRHYLEGAVPDAGTIVNCAIDWDRRYSHMKMHTSQHLLSAVIWDRYKAATVGNQIHAERSHIDFHPASFTMEDLKEVEDEVNSLIEKEFDVMMKELKRNDIEERIESERVDLSRLPMSVKVLRTIFIGEEGKVDMCPCAGTHVKNLSELGRMRILKRKSKGSGKVRVEYELV